MNPLSKGQVSPGKGGGKTPVQPKGGLFGARPYISRREMRQTLKRDSGLAPGSFRKFSSRERLDLEREFKGEPYFVSRKNVERHIKDLTREKYRTNRYAAKGQIERRIGYLQRMLKGL